MKYLQRFTITAQNDILKKVVRCIMRTVDKNGDFVNLGQAVELLFCIHYEAAAGCLKMATLRRSYQESSLGQLDLDHLCQWLLLAISRRPPAAS